MAYARAYNSDHQSQLLLQASAMMAESRYMYRSTAKHREFIIQFVVVYQSKRTGMYMWSRVTTGLLIQLDESLSLDQISPENIDLS